MGASFFGEQRRRVLEQGGDIRIDDLHVWRLGPGHHSAVVSVTSHDHVHPEELKDRLCSIRGLSHVTIEVDAAGCDSRRCAEARG